MKEVFTKALVLDRKDVNDYDSLIYLFTEEMGRISARAKSIRKITSKLSSHLQPMTFVKIRLVSSNGNGGFIVLDSVIDDLSVKFKTRKRHDLAQIISFLNRYLYDLHKDERLWNFLVKIFSGNYDSEEAAFVLLSILGVHNSGARCFICRKSPVSAFHIEENDFLCDNCSLKFEKNDILYIKPIIK